VRHLPGRLRLARLRLARLCLARLCLGRLCLGRLCLGRLCLARLCLARLCLARLCLARLCLARLCLGRLCLARGRLAGIRFRVLGALVAVPAVLRGAVPGTGVALRPTGIAVWRIFALVLVAVRVDVARLLAVADRVVERAGIGVHGIGFVGRLDGWRPGLAGGPSSVSRPDLGGGSERPSAAAEVPTEPAAAQVTVVRPVAVPLASPG